MLYLCVLECLMSENNGSCYCKDSGKKSHVVIHEFQKRMENLFLQGTIKVPQPKMACLMYRWIQRKKYETFTKRDIMQYGKMKKSLIYI